MADSQASIIGGVDTHKDAHVVAALDELGHFLGHAQFPASTAGYRALLGWLRQFGTLVAVGIEGTGTYGAGLSRYLTGKGITLVEVNRPNRQRRRRTGKSDPADAEAAARAVLAGDATGTPKTAAGPVEAIRVLRVARRTAMKARTQAANQVHAVISTAPEELRRQFANLSEAKRMARAARLRATDVTSPQGATKVALATLARRWIALTEEIRALDVHITQLVSATGPNLMAVKGVGTYTATALLVAVGDNPERLRTERSFAALCGASPLDASSGRQLRHRLNRGGDRLANSALHIIVVNRLRWDARTQAYLARRISEGKTKGEAIRCLKRYVARELYPIILKDFAPTATAGHSSKAA